jgi:hypothetical protein
METTLENIGGITLSEKKISKETDVGSEVHLMIEDAGKSNSKRTVSVILKFNTESVDALIKKGKITCKALSKTTRSLK